MHLAQPMLAGLLAGALATACLGQPPAEAEAAPATTSGAFRAVDHDRDGRVTQAEYMAYGDRIVGRRFAGIDTNHDGILTPDEYAEARRLSEERLRDLAPDDPARAEFAAMPEFKDVDTSGNGRISTQEFAVAQAASLRERFQRMDTDGDGALLPAEFDAARQRFIQMLGKGAGSDQ